jgi:hypothetical protein
MKFLDKADVDQYLSDYHQFPERRALILNTILALLREVIDDEIKCQRIILAPHERAGEASFAILETLENTQRYFDDDFVETFLYFFRKALRKLKPKKDHVCIEGLSIEDPNLNPEQRYIMKEQVELIKGFLSKNYDALTVDQFMRRFADSETYASIAADYDAVPANLIAKLNKVLGRVGKYMKRINNG